MTWKIIMGVALLVFVFMLPIIVMEIKEEPPTDYGVCIKNCPKTFSGYFKDLECLKMCEKLSECSNETKSKKTT